MQSRCTHAIPRPTQHTRLLLVYFTGATTPQLVRPHAVTMHAHTCMRSRMNNQLSTFLMTSSSTRATKENEGNLRKISVTSKEKAKKVLASMTYRAQIYQYYILEYNHNHLAGGMYTQWISIPSRILSCFFFYPYP